jgi:cellulose synthase/poly-beta-1,6-N-acetylglucosamine synthase-like glycosyltransferase
MPATVAIVIEWENAILSDVDRAREMLRHVNSQAISFARSHNTRFELVVMYDPRSVPLDVPKTTVDEQVNPQTWPGEIRFVEAPDLHYFEQKNLGTRVTSADAVLFVDSDVVPDAGWMAHMLEALDRPDVDLVSGQTYLATDTLLDRLFAGFWFFKPNPGNPELRRFGGFYANNFAARREVLERYPFAPAESYRGQCAALSRRMRADGVRMWRHGDATVSHPAPESLGHAFARAICHGYDNVYWQRLKPHGWLLASPIGAFLRWLNSIATLLVNVPSRMKVLRLGVPTAIGSFFFGLGFNTIIFGAEVVAWVAPGFIRKHVHM